MSVRRSDLEKYASRASDLTLDLTRSIYGSSEFDSNVRSYAEHFQRNLTASTKQFLESLDVIHITSEKPSGNIHEVVVDHLLRGGEEAKETPYDLVDVKEMLSIIEKEYIKNVADFVDINLSLTTPEKLAETYFRLIKKTLEDNIRKKRPDIFKILNPTQKTLEEHLKK